MKLKTRSLITTLTILSLALPIIAAPQQDQQRNCDQTAPAASDCQQDSQCIGTAQCENSKNQQGHNNRIGGQGRGHGWGQKQGKGMGMCGGSNRAIVPLTKIELPILMAMREEEKLAHDVYRVLDSEFTSPIFKNIAQSEQRHMDALKKTLLRQGLEDPITDPNLGIFPSSGFTELYKTLIAQGSTDYVAALKVGAYIEEIDIQDLRKALEVVTNPHLKHVFGNLLNGSYNHLRAFALSLNTEGVIYVPQVITPEDYHALLFPSPVNNPRRSR